MNYVLPMLRHQISEAGIVNRHHEFVGDFAAGVNSAQLSQSYNRLSWHRSNG